MVAFLIVRNEYERAVDAYHRALGSRSIGDYFKVYMSLWVLAEARRQGARRRPAGARLPGRARRPALVRRPGPLRRRPHRPAALQSRATTRGRRAELLYYTAVLGGDVRSDPSRARAPARGRGLAPTWCMFFEYDMAKHWLRNGFGRAPGRPT